MSAEFIVEPQWYMADNTTFVLSVQRPSRQANPFNVWFAHPEAPS